VARRTIEVEGDIWEVFPSGSVTVYGRDESGLVFQQGSGPDRKRRFTRYAPRGNQGAEAAFAELTERELTELWHESQPAWTAPDGAYGAR